VLGKADETGAPLFPIQGGMDSDLVAERLGPRLLRLADGRPDLAARIRRRLDAIQAARARPHETHAGRTPNYCSGCPHNVGTRLLPGEVAWGSPGCHSFASIIEQPERHIVSMTQLGGEGLPWIGLEPYTDRPHIVQNVGDGSLFHSSYLNIRFCVAAGANMTFKILYNGFVANTGAQEMVGGKPVPELTRMLELEGVRATVVLTKDPDVYRGTALAGNARVEAVERQDAVLRELAATPGVTVLIHDGLCANERRRRQKRRQLPTSSTFVVINEEVCEGCGHCGALTNCMSLHRVETELGPKTRIHASSCNQDLSCLGGDCPSFVTVETEPGTGYRRPSPPALPADAAPEPTTRVGLERPYHVYLPGVGGTGVITMNALLSWAALIDGLEVLSYDQTGAAQKWGPVLSSLILARPYQGVAANKVGLGQADLYLALDLLAAGARTNLDRCDPARTVAVVNASVLPSGEMVRNVDFAPPVDAIRRQIDRATRAEANVTVDARPLAEGLFADYMATNMLVLGVAYQAGLLPLTAGAIEQAIELNGVAVEQNVQAFRYGRLWVADPDRVRALVEPPARTFETERAAALDRLAGQDASAYVSLLDRCAHLDPDARRMLAFRVGELIDYQDARYAGEYVAFVLEVAAREAAIGAEAGRGDARGDPQPLQAHGLQGRVRGGAPPPQAGVPRGDAGTLRRAPPPRLASAPAAPARARTQAEAASRTLVPARAPGPARTPAPPGDSVRSFRLRRHPARRAAPGALVPRLGAGRARRWRRRRPRDGGRAGAPAGDDPWLRGHQAPQHRDRARTGFRLLG
jgi:indolepyruvate ferredoxin oxidoreductase